jgi:hypothetical protein
VILLGKPHLEVMGTIHPTLDDLTIVAFPAYRCEFSGNESPKRFDDLIHYQWSIVNWNRPCRPQVWMRIQNPEAIQRISPIGEWNLTEMDFIQSEIGHLSQPEYCVQVKNYMGRVISVRGRDGELILGLEGKAGPIHSRDVGNAMAVLTPFILQDAWPSDQIGR